MALFPEMSDPKQHAEEVVQMDQAYIQRRWLADGSNEVAGGGAYAAGGGAYAAETQTVR